MEREHDERVVTLEDRIVYCPNCNESNMWDECPICHGVGYWGIQKVEVIVGFIEDDRNTEREYLLGVHDYGDADDGAIA